MSKRKKARRRQCSRLHLLEQNTKPAMPSTDVARLVVSDGLLGRIRFGAANRKYILAFGPRTNCHCHGADCSRAPGAADDKNVGGCECKNLIRAHVASLLDHQCASSGETSHGPVPTEPRRDRASRDPRRRLSFADRCSGLPPCQSCFVRRRIPAARRRSRCTKTYPQTAFRTSASPASSR